MYLSDAEGRPGWIHGSSAATVSWHMPSTGIGRKVVRSQNNNGRLDQIQPPVHDTRFFVIQRAECADSEVTGATDSDPGHSARDDK